MIEDALQCLKNMVASFKKTTECFREQSGTMKRIKDTSGLDDDDSPHTARSRPSAKRATPLTPRQLTFGNDLSTGGTFVLQLACCSSLSPFLYLQQLLATVLSEKSRLSAVQESNHQLSAVHHIVK